MLGHRKVENTCSSQHRQGDLALVPGVTFRGLWWRQKGFQAMSGPWSCPPCVRGPPEAGRETGGERRGPGGGEEPRGLSRDAPVALGLLGGPGSCSPSTVKAHANFFFCR